MFCSKSNSESTFVYSIKKVWLESYEKKLKFSSVRIPGDLLLRILSANISNLLLLKLINWTYLHSIRNQYVEVSISIIFTVIATQLQAIIFDLMEFVTPI